MIVKLDYSKINSTSLYLHKILRSLILILNFTHKNQVILAHFANFKENAKKGCIFNILKVPTNYSLIFIEF
jgi:hypothetical protein